MHLPPLIVASLVSDDPPLAAQAALALEAGADAIELRVDRLASPDKVARFLADAAARFGVAAAAGASLPPRIILTIRDEAEGGSFRGSDDNRAVLFERLARPGTSWIDIEAAAWLRSERLRGVPSAIQRAYVSQHLAAPPPALILSYHADRIGTPDEIDAAIRETCGLPCDLAKVVFPTRDATDALNLLIALRSAARGSSRLTGGAAGLIVMGTGPAALMTRALAGKFGGAMVYAATAADRAAAAGQPTLQQLVETCRAKSTRENTKVYGVVGWPVMHSRSPHVHNAALASADLDGVFVPMPVGPDKASFFRFMTGIASLGDIDVRGLSITAPHKEHALQWVLQSGGDVSQVAGRCGAANTLIRAAGGAWSADNTDVPAAIESLQQAIGGPPADALRGRAVLVLGAGGVSRGLVAGLVDAGARVTIAARTMARARSLANPFGCATVEWAERDRVEADILINGTPVGQSPDDHESPMPTEALARGKVVFDTVYQPPVTRLLADAERAGCLTLSGVDMFLGQARRQFELWHGRRADERAMRDAMRHAGKPT